MTGRNEITPHLLIKHGEENIGNPLTCVDSLSLFCKKKRSENRENKIFVSKRHAEGFLMTSLQLDTLRTFSPVMAFKAGQGLEFCERPDDDHLLAG